jgi:hypothetical protein
MTSKDLRGITTRLAIKASSARKIEQPGQTKVLEIRHLAELTTIDWLIFYLKRQAWGTNASEANEKLALVSKRVCASNESTEIVPVTTSPWSLPSIEGKA